MQPLAAGGSMWDMDNLIALCRTCHIDIHRVRRADEWYGLGRLRARSAGLNGATLLLG